MLTLLLASGSSYAQDEPALLQRSGRVFTFGSFLSVSDSLFIERKDSITENGVTTETSSKNETSENLRIFSGNITYGEGLSTSAMKKITQENGDFILVSSRVNVNIAESGDDSAFTTQKYEFKRGNRRLEYIGSISKFGDTPESISTSITYIETHDFDPCIIDQISAAQIKGFLDDLDTQGKHSLKANCMIGKRLEGEFFASLIITDYQGETVREVDLSGSLTLEVSKALTVKYGRSYLRGEDPFENSNDFQQQQGNTGGAPFDPSQFLGSGIQIGNVNFINREHIQGKMHEFNIEHKTENEQTGCSLNKTLNIKLEEHAGRSIQDEKIYSLKILRDCEEKGSDSFSISNAFEQDGGQAVVLSFGKNILDKGEASNTRTKYNLDVGNSLLSNDWFTNFNITHRRIDSNGRGTESGFDVFYAENRDSYVVAKHILVAPVYGSDRYREFLAKKEGEETSPPPTLQDVDLCFKIDCESIGAAVTFKEDGGVFISAEGKTLVEAFGREIDFRVTTGFGLNDDDDAENEGFGSGIFSNNDSENFVQISVQAPGCKELYGGCAGLSIRKEENNTQFIFGGTVKF